MTRENRTLRKRAGLRAELLEERQLLAADPFKIVMLPDTQSLSQSSPATFNAQTQWVADHVQSENIAFLTHVGDVVDSSNNDAEWQNADAAMSLLDGDPAVYPDGLLPYSVAIGNHDYDDENSHNGSTQFNQYFGASRYAGKSWYGGSSADQLNQFQIFSADDQQFLHLTVEWEPRDSAIDWAQGILNAYADLPTIVTTHAYIDETGTHSTEQSTADGRSGLAVFQDLVNPNPQIFMVLGGHFGPERHQVSVNSAGSEVIEVLANYQGRPAGEDGFLRLIEFEPLANMVNFTTYSPSLDQFETDAESQFSLGLDFLTRFDLPAAPRARLTQPVDNGIGDFDAGTNSVTVNTLQPSFTISLLDFSGGIDDLTATNSALTLSKDGQLLSDATDYSFSYDAAKDEITLTSAGGSFNDGNYEISLNSGPSMIADQNGNLLVPVTLTVNVDTTIPNPPNSLYFSLNSTATLPGGLTAENEDILFFDGNTFSQFFDGSDVGLGGFTLDALDIISSNEILLSMTGSGTIPGISGTVDDSDIVKFTATQLGDNTSGSFELYFDGSDVGLSSSGEDVDSVDLLDDGRLLVSVRGTFSGTGASGTDEDIFAFTPSTLGESTSGTWEIYFDGSDVGLAAEDINSVSVYPDGNIYLSVDGSFNLLDSTVRDDDVLVFQPTALGDNTAGSIASSFFLDGSVHGLSPYDVMAIHVPLAVGGNSPPNAVSDAFVLAEGGTATQLSSGSISLLDNDTDADLPDDVLTLTTTPLSGPNNGSIVLNADGTFSYTHDGSENLSDSFVYEVRDAAGAADSAVVTITVTPVNDNAPVANDDSIVVSNGATATQLVGGSSSLLDNDTDLDLPNDALSVNTLPVVPPSNGSLTLSPDGSFNYTHNGSATTSDSFMYEVSDAAGAASTAFVTISITAVNNPPTASDGQVSTLEDVAYSFNTNEFGYADIDGDEMTQLQITSLPAGGTLEVLGNVVVLNQVIAVGDIDAGNLSYLPSANANGLNYDNFTFRVHDGTEYSAASYWMTIDVDGVNDPPVLAGLPDISFVQDTGDSSIDLDAFYADVETPASAAMFSIVSAFTGVSVSIDPATHVLTVTGDPGFTGEGDVVIQVMDTGDDGSPPLTDSDTIHVTVLPDTGDAVLLLGVDRNASVGGLSVANEDIVVFDGLSFEMLFDGSDVGIGGAKLDAFALLSSSELLLSFTSPQTISGIAATVDDSDIVKFTGTQFGDTTQGVFELYFDGSDVDLDGSSKDVDAVEVLPDGRIIISMTGSNSVTGLSVKDDDLLAFNATSLGEVTSGTWEIYFDGSDVGLSAEDLHGVAIDDNGDLLFNVQNDFIVGPIAGDDEDVFAFTPSSLGSSTSGTYASVLVFDGSQFGLEATELTDIDIVAAASLPNLGASASASSTQQVMLASRSNDQTIETPLEEPPSDLDLSRSGTTPVKISSADVDQAMAVFGLTAATHEDSSSDYLADELLLLDAMSRWS